MGKEAGVLVTNEEGMPFAILSASPGGSRLHLNDQRRNARYKAAAPSSPDHRGTLEDGAQCGRRRNSDGLGAACSTRNSLATVHAMG
jgi:hypothetical protein